MRKRSILAAAGLAAATIIGALALPTTASAGDGMGVFVDVEVVAPDASAVMNALTVEVWNIEGASPSLVTSPTCSEPIGNGGELADTDSVNCAVPRFGDYAIGIDGIPEGATATAECSTGTFIADRIPGANAEFTIDQSGEFAECTISVVQPTIFVDKIVADGDAAPGDFTIEVFSGGSEVASGTDTSANLCTTAPNSSNCAAITVPAGDLQLGESGPAGYVPSNVGCFTFRPEAVRALDVFPTGIGELTLSDQAQGDTMAYCEITNRYYEGDLVVTKSVTNDDGGTLGPAGFTAEVYTEPDGSLYHSGECDANGDCIAITVPIGDYRIGEANANGYSPSVSCTVTGDPTDPGPIGTVPPTTNPPIREAIPGEDAVATVEPGGEVTCEIVNDDPTTTTTMAPTTTDQGGGGASPTTVAPILPPTGDSNGIIAVIGALLIALGASLLVARRRTA